VERINRQVTANEQSVTDKSSKVTYYLKAGDRESAGKVVIELEQAKKDLAENKAQQTMYEGSYQNNVLKIKNAIKEIAKLKNEIERLGAELKMSKVEAEVAELATAFNFDVSTDIGQVADVVQTQIDRNRAKARVSVGPLRGGCGRHQAQRGNGSSPRRRPTQAV
jgi:uncharacterized small protein (DUF1192 family)